jgi:Zn-dependent peptidase ImmA (M78 family)/DNA-binding XRE family transcriptional regulator
VSDSAGFDPRRLTLARWSANLTKRELAERAELSPASITQYEAGRTLPPAATVARLALAVGMPAAYFERRQDRRRPDPAARSFFRSLRSTPQRDRDRADADAEHVFDLVSYLEKQVKLPLLDIPQLTPASTTRVETERIAEEVRKLWKVPDGPIANVVRLLEAHGVIVARLDSGGSKLDAFSRWFAERPLILLWADKGDKARSRFDAAHELGHLVMHSDPDPLDREQERQADMFASAFLMPAHQIGPYLPRRAPTQGDWPTVLDWRKHWGVSAKALLYRARELGALNEAAFRRSMVAYNKRGLQRKDGSELGDPETPLLMSRSLEALEFSDPLATVPTDALVPGTLVEALIGKGPPSTVAVPKGEVRALSPGGP